MPPIALGRSAATAIALDESDDDHSAPAPEATVLILSSDDEDDVSVRSVNILDVSAWGGSEATSRRKRRAPPVRSPVVASAAAAAKERPRSPAPSVVVLDGSPAGRDDDDDDDATSRHKKANKEPRPQAPVVVPVVSATAPSAADDVAIVLPPVGVGSPVVSAGPAASANGGRDNDNATKSRRKKANKEPRPRSPAPSLVSLRSPPVVDSSAANSAPSANGTTHEATTRQKRKQTRWAEQDELTLLATMAENRRDNDGVLETGSVLLDKLLEDGKLLRRSLSAAQLTSKLVQLREKFISAAAARYGDPGNVGGAELKYQSRYKHHNDKLYEKSKEVWPELLPAAQEPSTSSFE